MFKFLILWMFVFGIAFLTGIFIGWRFQDKITGIVEWVRRGFKK